MKNVIIYKRVSTDEQAQNGFSLESQNDKLVRYCKNNNLNIIRTIVDDHSAKEGFDRPGYKELVEFITKNKSKIDGILVTQWSRFSRDFNAAINEVARLRKMNIEPNAIEQWVDYSIPESLYMRMMYLVAPQVENERLSLRTIDCMRKASKLGKWQGSAPYGYYHNKAIEKADKALEIDSVKAENVKECFSLMSTGLYSSEAVRKIMKKEKGMRLTKQSFLNLLQNTAYIGKIKIAAYQDEPEQLVYGQHKAIIDSETFQLVQMIVKGRKKPYNGKTKKDELYLVGHLYCPKCDKVMTGSGSTGGSGRLYHYYHCQRKYSCKNEFRADNANDIFNKYLSSFQPEAKYVALYKEFLNDEFKSSGFDREREKEKLRNEIEIVEERINQAAIKNLDGVWNDEVFKRTTDKLEENKNALSVKLNTLNSISPEFNTYLSTSTAFLENLVGFYTTVSTENKKKIISSIFPEKIYFSNNDYRTNKINEVVELICSGSKGLKENNPAKNARLSSKAPPAGLEPATL